jgi:hypothetical protein
MIHSETCCFNMSTCQRQPETYFYANQPFAYANALHSSHPGYGSLLHLAVLRALTWPLAECLPRPSTGCGQKRFRANLGIIQATSLWRIQCDRRSAPPSPSVCSQQCLEPLGEHCRGCRSCRSVPSSSDAANSASSGVPCNVCAAAHIQRKR